VWCTGQHFMRDTGLFKLEHASDLSRKLSAFEHFRERIQS